jgi:hypothetical protein
VPQYATPPQMVVDPAKSYTATIETSAGTMSAELFAAEAPRTVNNFVFLAREGFYEGVIFHRVISGFMIQGGDPTGTGSGGPGYRFADEPVTRRYLRGTLAMANAGANTKAASSSSCMPTTACRPTTPSSASSVPAKRSWMPSPRPPRVRRIGRFSPSRSSR